MPPFSRNNAHSDHSITSKLSKSSPIAKSKKVTGVLGHAQEQAPFVKATLPLFTPPLTPLSPMSVQETVSDRLLSKFTGSAVSESVDSLSQGDKKERANRTSGNTILIFHKCKRFVVGGFGSRGGKMERRGAALGEANYASMPSLPTSTPKDEDDTRVTASSGHPLFVAPFSSAPAPQNKRRGQTSSKASSDVKDPQGNEYEDCTSAPIVPIDQGWVLVEVEKSPKDAHDEDQETVNGTTTQDATTPVPTDTVDAPNNVQHSTASPANTGILANGESKEEVMKVKFDVPEDKPANAAFPPSGPPPGAADTTSEPKTTIHTTTTTATVTTTTINPCVLPSSPSGTQASVPASASPDVPGPNISSSGPAAAKKLPQNLKTALDAITRLDQQRNEFNLQKLKHDQKREKRMMILIFAVAVLLWLARGPGLGLGLSRRY